MRHFSTILNSTSTRSVAGRSHACAEHTFSFLSHSSHHVLAVYALGASPELIRDVYYKTHVPKLLPALLSPGPISEANFTEHLGDEKYILCLLSINRD